MHLLDRLAAFAVILQFVAVCLLLALFFHSSASQQRTLNAIETRVYSRPQVVVVNPTATPSATMPVVTGYFRSNSGVVTTAPVLPKK